MESFCSHCIFVSILVLSITITPAYNRPTLLAAPNPTSPDPAVFSSLAITWHELTTVTLFQTQKAMWGPLPANCVLKSVTSHIWFLSRQHFVANVDWCTTVREPTRQFPRVCLSHRIIAPPETVTSFYCFKRAVTSANHSRISFW
jgi:hypothetical protein